MVNSTVVQIIQDVDLLCFIRNNHITKLQSGCRGQATPPFKQLLCGLPTGKQELGKKWRVQKNIMIMF